MQLLEKQNLSYELLIESIEDLWVLSQFITSDDQVFGTTVRKVKIGNETSTKQVKKIIFAHINVSNVKFENETLKISGNILNETEFTAIGQSHSMNFQVGDKIKLEKKNLLKYEEKMLEKAIKTKKSHNLLILLDKDELLACEFGEYAYKILFENKGLGEKKYITENINENEQKYLLIQDLLKKDYSKIIFAGPGIWKENLKKYIKDKIGIDTLTFPWHDVSNCSIQKIIKAIINSGLLTESQLGHETETINKLLENISLGKKFTYGYENTQNNINEGKIEKMLVSSKFIEKKKEENEFSKLNELMKMVEELGGELIILSSKNEPGKILDGLGGIGGICRY